MNVKDALNVLDDMVIYIEDNWDDEDEILRISRAVGAVKSVINSGKVVGTLTIKNKNYVISEGGK